MDQKPMNLRDYMEDRGLNDALVAVQLGVNPSTVYRWRTGQAEPRRKIKGRIMNWSRGVVTYATWAELYQAAA